MSDHIRTWFLQRSKLEWNPQRIPPPQVDPDLTHLSGTQRMVESLRFFVLTAEHWISPDGALREWLRVMCKLGLLILCPLVIFMPTVSFALWQLALCVAFLVAIMKNLILFPLAALVAIALCGVLVIIIRSIFGR
jgi:hypothetical protein